MRLLGSVSSMCARWDMCYRASGAHRGACADKYCLQNTWRAVLTRSVSYGCLYATKVLQQNTMGSRILMWKNRCPVCVISIKWMTSEIESLRQSNKNYRCCRDTMKKHHTAFWKWRVDNTSTDMLVPRSAIDMIAACVDLTLWVPMRYTPSRKLQVCANGEAACPVSQSLPEEHKKGSWYRTESKWHQWTHMSVFQHSACSQWMVRCIVLSAVVEEYSSMVPVVHHRNNEKRHVSRMSH